MTTSIDRDYWETKLIKQGKAEVNSDFKPLCDWINKEYGIRPINIIYDVVPLAGGVRTPRLQVVLEFLKERGFFLEPFTYPNQALGNFDKRKQQAVVNQFKKVLFDLGLNTKKTIWNWWQTKQPNKYNVNDLFVYFSNFDDLACEEANNSLSEGRVWLLEKEINNPNLWKIVKGFRSATFFFYKDSQIQDAIKDGLGDYFSDKYFTLLKSYDEFDYIKREHFSVSLDSKENFDKNYGSNWFDYFR